MEIGAMPNPYFVPDVMNGKLKFTGKLRIFLC